MSIIENEAIIQPRRGKREQALPSGAVLVFTSQDVELLVSRCPSLTRRSGDIYLSKIFVGIHNEVPFALAGPMLGAPQAVLVLEKLIALGVTRVIALGWCGSLQPHVTIGDVVLPTGAFSEEGTSPHYPVTSEKPGPARELLDSLRCAVAGGTLQLHEGTVWSTDAPFRETYSKVMHYQQQGALAVDMETSALFAIASFRGIRMAVALVVSDELSSLKWVHGFRNPAFVKAREALAASVPEAVSSLE